MIIIHHLRHPKTFIAIGIVIVSFIYFVVTSIRHLAIHSSSDKTSRGGERGRSCSTEGGMSGRAGDSNRIRRKHIFISKISSKCRCRCRCSGRLSLHVLLLLTLHHAEARNELVLLLAFCGNAGAHQGALCGLVGINELPIQLATVQEVGQLRLGIQRRVTSHRQVVCSALHALSAARLLYQALAQVRGQCRQGVGTQVATVLWQLPLHLIFPLAVLSTSLTTFCIEVFPF
mmetsp:Transcript_19446/g.33689  ORF Transcript_19446/g.33689 Transcript_19446/m.33689 type:complete len:231 (-) Transcript_19446:240-932(-)